MNDSTLAPVYADIVDIGESAPNWVVTIDIPNCLQNRFRQKGEAQVSLQGECDLILAKCTGEIEVAESVLHEVVEVLREHGVRAMTGVGIE